MLEMIITGQYKKDCRRMSKRGKDMTKLNDVIQMLCNGETLPASYDDHRLQGKSKGCRECHIEPDWLLEYKIDRNDLVLVAMRTGSHCDLRFC